MFDLLRRMRSAGLHAPRCGRGRFSSSAPQCPECRYWGAAPCAKHKTLTLVRNFVVDKAIGFTWWFSCLPFFPSPARGHITLFVHFVKDGIIIAISQSGLRAVQVEALVQVAYSPGAQYWKCFARAMYETAFAQLKKRSNCTSA